MNFWEKQRKSRSKTKSYVFLFYLAVVLIIAIVNALVFFAFPQVVNIEGLSPENLTEIKLKTIGITTFITVAVVFIAYLIKRFQLSSGGRSVAKMLGARELEGNLTDKELIYRNVVEEISVASGVVVPSIYILDNEMSINAFVAGHDPNDCIVCITKGSLDLLDRDELQAVIAHEYGHIFNGDMLLNMKLISVLFGILAISEIGRLLTRGSSGTRRSSSRSNRGGGQVAIFGFALFIIGSIGYFFASLIQARISREREYLADSCSVQYTRNPDAIVRLFKKIHMQDAKWMNKSESKQIAHMFFSQSLKMFSFFATHPPLFDRIEHVDPKFDREHFEKIGYKEFENKNFDENWEKLEKKQAMNHLIKEGHISGLSSSQQSGESEDKAVINRVGGVDDASLSNSIEILTVIIPEDLKKYFYRKKECVLVTYALFIDEKNYEKREQQLSELKKKLSEEDFTKLKEIVDHVIKLPPKTTISILELVVPALRRLRSDQLSEMYNNIDLLIKIDKKKDVYEFLLLEVLESLISKNRRKKEYDHGKTLKSNKEQLEGLISFWNIVSHRDKEDASKSFEIVAQELGLDLEKVSRKKMSYKLVKDSLGSLKFLSSEDCEKLIKGLVRGILSDGVIKPIELMFLKMVCLTLSVPFPQID